jgi:glyoxylase-like metal-dependent hydrolase (beta-lactamase superfamily II)
MAISSRFTAALAATALAATAGPAAAQQALPLTTHTIKEGKLYWVEGGGGNSGIIIGDKGVVLIDAKINAEAGRALVAEVARLTPKPITHVIETHSDGDHVNGIAGFPAGVRVIAHVNNWNDQIVVPLMASVEVGGGKCIPPPDRLPDMLVYNDRVSTTLDGEKIGLYNFGPAHTTGDLIVYLPAYRVAFTGDILTFNVLIHPEKNGSLEGWFRTMRGLLGLDATTFVPGHGKEPDTRLMLQKRVADIQASRDKVGALADQGKSLAEIKVAMGDPPKDAPGCRGLPYPSLTWVEYYEHANRKAELK